MFKKKPTIKTLSPLRSSDRRKTAEQIISDYGLSVQEQPPSEDKDAQAAATAAHSILRNQLLPESSLSAKFTTTSGPDLKEVHGMVYVGNHESGKEQRVLWVRMYDRLYPSVYTLWHNPGILPLIHTPSIVVDKLKGGADLMTPGLIGPPFPAKATKGAIVAVASSDSPSVPIVVGTCVIDISKLEKVQGSKGHAVETFHWAGDDLWDWSTSGKSGVPAPSSLEGWLKESGSLEQGMEELDVNEKEGGGVSIAAAGKATAEGSADTNSKGPDSSRRDDLDAEEESDLTQQDIDHAFHQAFLYGIYSHMQANPGTSNCGLTFPLTQSFVLQHLVHPFLPTFTQKQTAALVIKKTSWKNGRKFIKYLDKQKLILSKDRSNNEVDILDVDFDDPVIKSFQPYSLPTKSSTAAGAQGKAAGPANGGDDSVNQKLKKLDLYRPTDKLSPLFQSASNGSKALYTAAEIRPIITTYIESNNLVNTQNKRLVTLDPIISNAVFTTSQPLDAEVLQKGSVPRDALIDRILTQCNPYHAILRNDDTLDSSSVKPKAGPAPRLGIVMETRGGNKTATRIHGLEPYFVSPQLLADELRKTCASSTSVEPYKAGGKGMMEVMVQGPQRDAVLKALEKRGVQKAWVDVADKTKGKKKQ